jgi:phytoene/squalene synthetase
MRSESADPLEAAKSFYEAKNNLAEFYIEKQKNDEIKAIEDEKERYGKQFKENTEAQEAIYGASMDRMKNRFEAVNRVLGEEAIDPADLKNLLLLTMSGKVPTITSNYDSTMAALFEQVDKQVAEGKQELALGEGLGTISIGTLTPDGKAYTPNSHLVDGNLDKNIKSKYGFDKIYKGSNEESGLLATFMNEILAAGVSFTDSGETYKGAAALEYLKKIRPSKGFEGGAAAGMQEQGRERQGLFEYLTSLLSTTNTFDSSQKLAILAQRTLEQSISDFEKATKIDVNMAGLLEADIANEMFETFIKSMGQTPDEAKIAELKELVRDTYTDVLAAMDAREYEKFASSADPRIGQLTNQVDQISDSITHLKDSLDGGLTNLDKLLFGTTYNSAAPIPGIDVATEQIDVITAAILDMQTAFEVTMDSLEAYADSLEGPIGAFHQMAADLKSIAGLAGGLTLPTAGAAAPTPASGGKVGSQSFTDGVTGGPVTTGPSISEEAKNTLQELMRNILNNGGDQMLSNMPILGGLKRTKPVVDAPAGSPEAEIIARLQRAEENLKIQQKLREEAAQSGLMDNDMGMELSKAKMELDRARAEYEKYISGVTQDNGAVDYLERLKEFAQREREKSGPAQGPGEADYQQYLKEFAQRERDRFNDGMARDAMAREPMTKEKFEEYTRQEASTMPVSMSPVTEFNAELKAKLAEYAAAFASSVQTVGINGAQTTTTMYNQIPINITINDAQDMNTAELAAQVEEAVGRALRASGGSYINGTTS